MIVFEVVWTVLAWILILLFRSDDVWSLTTWIAVATLMLWMATQFMLIPTTVFSLLYLAIDWIREDQPSQSDELKTP